MRGSAPAWAASRRAWPARGSVGGSRPRPRGRDAGRRARRAEGPADEGRAAAGDHPRRCCRPNTPTSCRSCRASAPPMGPAFVRRRMMAELGADWRDALRVLRPRAGRRRLARPGAPRRRATTARRSPASCNIPTCSRRSRPISPARHHLRRAAAHRPGDRHARDRSRRSASACARSSTTAARPATRRSMRDDARRASREVRVPASWPELSTGRLLTHGLARRRAAARLQGRRRWTIRNRLAHGHVHAPGGIPSPISA